MTLTEIFTKAIMNTILGMGVVFSVLIFIAFIISLFKYLPGLLENRKGKGNTLIPQASDPVPQADIGEGDPVLAAVITAAVHAFIQEETISTDAYIVRSIRRS